LHLITAEVLLRADLFLRRWMAVVMSSRQKTGGGSARDERNAPRKRRPPWGSLLGGKPIERHVWNFNAKYDLGEQHVRRMQFLRMRKLKKHYKIVGGDYDYPIQGVGPADWLPWYELALAIASEFDHSLKIIDIAPRGQTARRWRGGLEGLILLRLVDDYLKAKPGRSVLWCLKQLQQRYPEGYGRMPLRQLAVRYQEAKRHEDATKKALNQKSVS
jgi:hypothetical protein